MNTTKATYFLRRIAFLFLAVLLVAACKKDEDNGDNNNPPPPTPNPLVGTYSFLSATFDQPITVIVNGDTINYQIGDDASVFVGGGLLGAAPCANDDNAALQLRDDFTSWYVCQGESNESQQGTWEPLADNAVLKLYIANPADFVVSIGITELTSEILNGKIESLPMPYDTSIAVGDPLPGGGINFQVAQVSLQFARLE